MTMLMAVNARPIRHAKLTQIGAGLGVIDQGLPSTGVWLSGVLSLTGSASPVWVPYSSNSLTFIERLA